MNRDLQRMSDLWLRHVDEFLVHQLVVRRFKGRHSDDFNALVALRKELEKSLDAAFPLPAQYQEYVFSEVFELRMRLVACCFSQFDTQTNRRRLSLSLIGDAYKIFLEDLEALAHSGFDPFRTLGVLYDDDVRIPLFEILLKHAKSILDIHRRLNFFDYYSFFALTSFAGGANIYDCYIRAKIGVDTIELPSEAASTVPGDAKWFFSTAAATDDELSAIVHTDCYLPNRPSKNIQIFGGGDHVVTVNGVTVSDCLFFCVPTNQIPDRIDESLHYFRHALLEKLEDYTLSSSSAKSFRQSKFMNLYSRSPLLIKEWRQVQKHIIGLWALDITNADHVTLDEDPAYVQVANEIYKLKNSLEHDLDIYTEGTVKQYYDDVVKVAGSFSIHREPVPAQLDRFVTGEDIFLGTRNKL